MRADAQENQDRILEAAARVFTLEGADTSLKAIAKAAGVGIGTLYRRFPAREDLIEATYRSETARLAGSAEELLGTLPPDAALREWMDRFVEYTLTKNGMAEALPAILASRTGLRAHSRDLLRAAIDRMLRAGSRGGHAARGRPRRRRHDGRRRRHPDRGPRAPARSRVPAPRPGDGRAAPRLTLSPPPHRRARSSLPTATGVAGRHPGGSRLAPVEPLQADDPQQVGRYRLVGRLGLGGMGRVYAAAAPDGRRAAVKVIRDDLADDTGFRRRFRREVAAASAVAGLFTARVLDADPDGDPPWLATEFVEGPSVRDAVLNGPSPSPRCSTSRGASPRRSAVSTPRGWSTAT